jgi:hypothetical protein
MVDSEEIERKQVKSSATIAEQILTNVGDKSVEPTV